VTEEFRAFARGDRPAQPEWLFRVKQVYWTDSGALWANTQMPTVARERAFTIDKICQALSDYASTVARQPGRGASVRNLDGTEAAPCT
jgi:hypothetical protein